MGLLCCATKCCGCIMVSQLCALLLPLGILAALALLFYTVAIPWGEDQIRQALNLAPDVNIGDLNTSFIEANSCSGCAFGSNTQWPTNTTGTRHFLDSYAGSTASGVIATSLAAAGVIGTGSMLWASAIPSAAAALSFSAGFYEMTHIVEQAQFAGMISQLRLEGAPTFLLQFSKELSWTNFNLVRGSSDGSGGGEGGRPARRLDDTNVTSLFAAASESGPARYAAMIGIDADNLFFYTLVTFVVVIAVLHALFFVFVLVYGALVKKESFSDLARKWYRKVIWAGVLALLLAQYMFAMSGSYFISLGSSHNSENSFGSRYYLGIVALAAVILLAIGLGVIVVGSNTNELRDIGTYEHNQRAFSSKYSAYYDEYNFDNRFFFVPRIVLAVSTGVVVGTVQDATIQLVCIMAITMLYLILLLIRQPNLLWFLYYIGIASVFMKVVLICLMLMVARADYFPQSVRDNVSYGIIGVNMFVFFLLFVRQAYTIIHNMIIACRRKEGKEVSHRLDATDIDLEYGNNASTRGHTYEGVESVSSSRGMGWHGDKPPHQQYNQPQEQYYRSLPNNVPSFRAGGSRDGHPDNVPMLEQAPDPASVFNHSRDTAHPPISRNQQYSFGNSTQSTNAFAANNAASAPAYAANNAASAPAYEPIPEAPIPTYDVLAAYLGTNQANGEASSHSSRGNFSASRGQNSSRGQYSSRSLASSRGLSQRGTANALGASGSDFGSRPSTVPLDEYASSLSKSSSSLRKKRSVNVDELQKNVNGVDIDDVVGQPSASSSGWNFAPAASMDRSYMNFSDSVASSTTSQLNMSQNSAKSNNTFSTAIGATAPGASKIDDYGSSPQAKISIFSNDSDRSFDSDRSSWLKARSKTVVSVDEESEINDAEGQSYELGVLGVTTSAFKQRVSTDSYGYQSQSSMMTSHVDFNSQSGISNMGSDDGMYYPSRRQNPDFSNNSFVSAQSSDSAYYYDADKVRRNDENTLTI